MAQDLITGSGFLDPGQRNAEVVYNDALLRLTAFSAKCVDTVGPALPATPTAPYLMILDAVHPIKPNQIAYYWADGQWFYVQPSKYMIYFNLATSAYIRFNGTVWGAV
jgi:hypothetical protein